jgi:hypothetical protein
MLGGGLGLLRLFWCSGRVKGDGSEENRMGKIVKARLV